MFVYYDSNYSNYTHLTQTYQEKTQMDTNAIVCRRL